MKKLLRVTLSESILSSLEMFFSKSATGMGF